jgi:hypothetical protein
MKTQSYMNSSVAAALMSSTGNVSGSSAMHSNNFSTGGGLVGSSLYYQGNN